MPDHLTDPSFWTHPLNFGPFAAPFWLFLICAMLVAGASMWITVKLAAND